MDRGKVPKTVLFWCAVILVAVFLWQMVSIPSNSVEEMRYSEFLDQVQKNNIRQLAINVSQNTSEGRGQLRDSAKPFRVTIPNATLPTVTETLHKNGVELAVADRPRNDWLAFLLNATPLLLLVGFWIFMMRQLRSRRGGPGSPTT